MGQAPAERREESGGLGPPAIHAPWRSEYLAVFDADVDTPRDSGSFLREYWLHPEDDHRNHVIVRTSEGLILLNRYPYTGGHLLVALGEARPRLLDYTPQQRATLWALTDQAVDLVEQALRPQGVNIGANQGRAAGAGLPGHFHIHVVPRWHGDVNFMAVVGQVRVISQSLEHMARRYRETWTRMLQAREP